MSKQLLFAAALLITGCADNQMNQAEIDKYKNLDSVVQNTLFDTVGVSAAPVRLLHAELVPASGSNKTNLAVSWSNTGIKPVSAVRFHWYGLNAFGEPAEMGGNVAAGFGSGYVDRKLAPGAKDSDTWPINSRDAKKVVMVWPYEIVFEDGSKWASTK